MAKATRKTYEALAQLYVDRDMEVELSDDELLESLSISYDEFKDYVRASNIRHRRHVAKCEQIFREQRFKKLIKICWLKLLVVK
tara:strand:+ start:1947 stop:2198 length:252 start_codon:yes stop_codon:yes gene_type:complete